MRSDIVPGGVFPDYQLPDHSGEMRKLSELQGEDPLILTLARGHYCPKEHQQHLELAPFTRRWRWLTRRSPRSPLTSTIPFRNFVRRLEPNGRFFLTPVESFRRVSTSGVHDPEHDPMIPHTLVLKPGLVVYSIYNGYWFWGRPSISDLWRDLRAVTSEIRPDWDLSAPGLREAWKAGDHSRFHGWSKHEGAESPSTTQKKS
ncbi:MAG: AhpC/TSA family protein [Terracidiphilus sp.]